ncbi:hypothetical protein fHeYen902_068c [Yersinia phage fHe-Yen9-02]|nr:hypothetical protein fHeYen902_068c [Yersinia phage fHe-Yen9-02]
MSILKFKETISSESATKLQTANAKAFFGTKGAKILATLEVLHKAKELNTEAKINPLFDFLSSNKEDVVMTFAKSKTGTSIVSAYADLAASKTIVQVINSLRRIKVPKAMSQSIASAPTAKTKAPVKAAPVTRTDEQTPLPKVTITSITPKFIGLASKAQIDSIAAQLSDATGMTFVGTPVENANGQSAVWNFESANPNSKYTAVYIDPPFYFNEYSSSSDWVVSARTKAGKFAFGSPMRKPTAVALAKEVKAVIGKAKVLNAVKAVDMPKTYKITELRRMNNSQRVTFTKRLMQVLGLDALTYGISNNGIPFTSEPGEPWEMDGHVGSTHVFITFDGPYYTGDTGKWAVSAGEEEDKDFSVNDFGGMRAHIHGIKPKGRK